jgi:hypothetical protein
VLKKYKYTILWALWVIAVAVLCLLPTSDIQKAPRIPIPHFDKVVHCAFYLGYTVLFILMCRLEIAKKTTEKKIYLWAFITSISLGISIEALQALLTTTRSADMMDVLANTFGTIIAIGFMKKCKAFFRETN